MTKFIASGKIEGITKYANNENMITIDAIEKKMTILFDLGNLISRSIFWVFILFFIYVGRIVLSDDLTLFS